MNAVKANLAQSGIRRPAVVEAAARSSCGSRRSGVPRTMLPRDSGDKRSDAKRGLRRGRERDAIFFNDRSARPLKDGGRSEESGLGTMFRASAGQRREARTQQSAQS